MEVAREVKACVVENKGPIAGEIADIAIYRSLPLKEIEIKVMKRLRTIKGVLHNFLGTYTSRYSDYEGYWLFGLLVGGVEKLRVDLLYPNADMMASPHVVAAIELAAQRFRDQMNKAGLSISCAREARLDITRLPEFRSGTVNNHPCPGYDVEFVATVISESGKTYENSALIFVAPHNPAIESRSARGIPDDGESL